jgi:hypothetical protein
MHYGSGTGFGSRSNIKWNKKGEKSKIEIPNAASDNQ